MIDLEKLTERITRDFKSLHQMLINEAELRMKDIPIEYQDQLREMAKSGNPADIPLFQKKVADMVRKAYQNK